MAVDLRCTKRRQRSSDVKTVECWRCGGNHFYKDKYTDRVCTREPTYDEERLKRFQGENKQQLRVEAKSAAAPRGIEQQSFARVVAADQVNAQVRATEEKCESLRAELQNAQREAKESNARAALAELAAREANERSAAAVKAADEAKAGAAGAERRAEQAEKRAAAVEKAATEAEKQRQQWQNEWEKKFGVLRKLCDAKTSDEKLSASINTQIRPLSSSVSVTAQSAQPAIATPEARASDETQLASNNTQSRPLSSSVSASAQPPTPSRKRHRTVLGPAFQFDKDWAAQHDPSWVPSKAFMDSVLYPITATRPVGAKGKKGKSKAKHNTAVGIESVI